MCKLNVCPYCRHTLQNPCPFCGSHDVEVIEVDSDRFCVLCKECEAQGPAGSESYIALFKWNSYVDFK